MLGPRGAWLCARQQEVVVKTGRGAKLCRLDPGSTTSQQGDPGQAFHYFPCRPARASQGTDLRLRSVPSKSCKKQHLWKGGDIGQGRGSEEPCGGKEAPWGPPGAFGMGWSLCVALPWDVGAGPWHPPLTLRLAATRRGVPVVQVAVSSSDLTCRGTGL